MLGGRCPPVTSDRSQPQQPRRSRASLDAAPSRASGFVPWRDYDVRASRQQRLLSGNSKDYLNGRHEGALPPKLVDEVIGSFPGMVARNLPVGFPSVDAP